MAAPRTPSRTPGKLGDLLNTLERVMEEARLLREHISRQLAEQRRMQQQRISPVRKRASHNR